MYTQKIWENKKKNDQRQRTSKNQFRLFPISHIQFIGIAIVRSSLLDFGTYFIIRLLKRNKTVYHAHNLTWSLYTEEKVIHGNNCPSPGY